jgi:preprotein translocase subunit SecE
MKPFRDLSTYFRGVASELRKVVWPTFPVLLTNFMSVVIGIALATAFIGVVDYVFIHGIAFLIKPK